jgi:hypothetical protein
MILILRGHIRDSFGTVDLLNLVQDIYAMDPYLKIYIHTWNVYANRISWRHVHENNTPVTKKTIYDYFGNLKHLIQHIIIEDDSTISLIGNVKGNICSSKMPVLGWKNYWYGKHKIIQYVKQTNSRDVVINTRFDILDNSNSFKKKEILKFIQANQSASFTKNKFMFEKNQVGIDNLYIGNVDTMAKLASTFFYHLDEIEQQYPSIQNQECLVFLVNERTSHVLWAVVGLVVLGMLLWFRDRIRLFFQKNMNLYKYDFNLARTYPKLF